MLVNKILLLIPIFLVFLLVPSMQNSFAESEYSLSHFSSKGTIKNLPDVGSVWTMINDDKGTIVWAVPGSYSVARLDMQTHHMCYDDANVVCLNGTITSVTNSQFVHEDDIVTIVYDMPDTQTISFLSGDLVANGFEVELKKFKAKEATKIVEIRANEIIDNLEREVHLKILDAQELLKNELLQERLIESNQEFYNYDDLYAEIDKRNYEWEIDRPDPSPFEDTLINNEISDLLREEMQRDSLRETKFVYKEIILTNAYGANVAQTDRTTDYKQWDEQWWQLAKQKAISFQSGYDESAEIQSFDISLRITAQNGGFLGIIKFVVNIE